ncbi:AAA family ATPase [Sphingosinicella sp. CPCC 101087]|uniref:AAA family ATPase n=1 Tax=Sphingosinicella sp. CPCC 101087 TaxID=2497754 RepID=UPI00101DFEAE|nr:AAA family ATPase [Sphingosinicella sp. CPCC 101087]
MKLIFLFGPAASGKLTIARQISARTGLPVFHNHLVVDALLALFPFGSDPFVRLRERFWIDAFDAAAKEKTSFIFTFAPEPTVDPAFPEQVRTLVEGAGGQVHFVRLTVPPEEQERRLVDPSRREFAKLKSVDLLRELRAKFDIGACEAAMPQPELIVDTTAWAPPEAAGLIVERLGLPKAPPGAPRSG